MTLSKTWTDATEIYKTNFVISDFSKLIYRDKNGFEAFVISEDEKTYTIKGNGIKCKVWKSTTKSKIKKVSSDYILRKLERR